MSTEVTAPQAAITSTEDKFYPPKAEAPAKAPEAAAVPDAPKPTEVADKPLEEVKPPADASKEEAPKDAPKEGEEPVKEEPKVPEKYDLKLPESSLLPPERLADIEEFAKANALSQESAQKMVEREHQLIDGFQKAQQAMALAEAQAWGEQVAKDPVMGGENFKQTAFYASKGMQVHGSPDLEQILNETGYGNHPSVVKLFAKLGRQSAPDTFETSGSLPVEKKSMEQRWYASSTAKSEG